MTIDDIDAVFGFANGMKAVDDVEIKGLTAVFGDKLAEKPVVELKEVLGESRAAAATTAAHTQHLCLQERYLHRMHTALQQTEAFLRLMLKLLS